MDSFLVKSAPHRHQPDSTRTIMADVILALVPALVWGVYLFGWRALLICILSVGFCLGFEALFQMILRRKVTVSDGSAVVTGLLLAMNFSVSVPLWMPVVGSFAAIVLFKQLFGGIGKNMLNPVLASRACLRLAFPAAMTSFVEPFSQLPVFSIGVSEEVLAASAGVTPQGFLKNGQFPTGLSLYDLVSGSYSGRIGEVSALLLAAGGLYLLFKRVISWHIPVGFFASLALLCFLFPSFGARWEYMLWQLFSGGLFLIVIFMATDPCTTPITGTGKLLFGFGCGLITFCLRKTDLSVEGAVVAVLIMNALSPLLDRLRFLPKLKKDKAPS